ncbi:unnamed protein product, partial [Brenthis ino]
MNCNVLLDDQGNPAKTIKDKLHTWQNYITTLFHDVSPAPESSSCGSELTGPPINKSEIAYAIINMSKSGKSVGGDELPVELLKVIEYANLGIIVKLFNTIYDSGVIPSDWLN